MKKSELLKIIKEEVEVVLTDEEAVEIFDLNLAALLEASMSGGKDPSISKQLPPSSIKYVTGTDPRANAKGASLPQYAQKEREEIISNEKKMMADRVFSDEEKLELRNLEHIETMVAELFDNINLADKKVESAWRQAAETFRKKIQSLVRTARAAAADNAGPKKIQALEKAGAKKPKPPIQQRIAAATGRAHKVPDLGGPDKSVDEGKKKKTKKKSDWIGRAIDPEHKGDCTPMSKSTCTPPRKAMAKRFKKAARKKKREGGTGWQGKV